MWARVLGTLHRATLGDFLDILIIAFNSIPSSCSSRTPKPTRWPSGWRSSGGSSCSTKWGGLGVSNRLIRSFINYIIIAVIVLFQGEIRRFLTGIGSRTIRRPLAVRSLQEKLDDLLLALEYLSQKRIGALIAIEREISLSAYVDRGTRVDALLSKDLLVGIFFPHSPLHDGAVIIRGNRIVSAGCLLPLPASAIT